MIIIGGILDDAQGREAGRDTILTGIIGIGMMGVIDTPEAKEIAETRIDNTLIAGE